jgi:integration host factor subunit beta
MATITKKELIDRIADSTAYRRVQVKKIVQQFLDEIIGELGRGNRLEFRDFGVFETKLRKARRAQNPKTLQPVEVPEKRTVKFKVGRLMKQKLSDMTGGAIDDEAGDVAEMGDEDDEEGTEETEAKSQSESPSGT